MDAYRTPMMVRDLLGEREPEALTLHMIVPLIHRLGILLEDALPVRFGNGPPPVADFTGTPTSGNAPQTVSVSDASSGSVDTWSWSFGDSTTSSAQNPSHTYTATGTYSVSLTVTGPGGSDSETKVGYITVGTPPPTADFTGTPTSGTAPLTVSFSDATSGSVTAWSW